MTDETTSVWADIWAKVKASFAWVASWVADYPKVALVVILALAVLAVF